jgi:hypothetical protein
MGYPPIVRTTVDIDDRILERAKRHAASTGQTLGAVVSKALGAYLSSRRSREDPPFELIVRGRPGGRFPSPEELARVADEEDIAALRIPGRGGRAAS